MQGELLLIDGLVVYNHRIVISVSQHKDILHKLHEMHQGLNKCQQNAQPTIWWPGLSSDCWCVGSIDQPNILSHFARLHYILHHPSTSSA
ncbi:hypothetical protein BaRGS_00007191 [Batillaria attramentaria]|uniref:Integrase zinc-binding domain-containing protein n=1 Tax=Batillaria attramentaria TaxID=370345 RepID=A0ABD0LQI6_9CAEN